jgi:acyl transferase domain-containing protein
VLASGPRPLEQLVSEAPDVLQLALFGTSIALWTVLGEAGRQTGMLTGHSSGEIAALVAGGAFTVAEGAEIVVHRNAVLSGLAQPSGGMLALACDAERARRVLEAVGDPLVAVAVRNGRRQVVVSGPVETLATIAAVARVLQVSTTALTVAYPFHSPMLAEAVPEFAARIRHIEPRPLRALVFSPILGRFHRAGDALGEHLASSLVAPVDFDGALQRLHDAGARTFVECATAGTLTRLVQRCLPEASVLPALTAAGLDAEPARGHAAGLAAVPALPVPAVRSAPAVDTTPSRPAVAPAPLAAVAPAAVPAVASSGGGRDELFAELVAIYAQALEYPAEVFTEDVALEEDLGIDSVKQTELMARVAEQYALPEPPQDFRLGDYDTMGKLVDYVWTTAATVDQSAQPVRVAV